MPISTSFKIKKANVDNFFFIFLQVFKISLFLHDNWFYTIMNRLKKLKKIRLHREGTSILIVSAILLIGINALLFWGIECKNKLILKTLQIKVVRNAYFDFI